MKICPINSHKLVVILAAGALTGCINSSTQPYQERATISQIEASANKACYHLLPDNQRYRNCVSTLGGSSSQPTFNAPFKTGHPFENQFK
jgi:type II secretory pathway component PulL